MSDYSDLVASRVLVTGGHGFIGRHVMERLNVGNAAPIAIAQHEGDSVESLPGETVFTDLEDPGQMANVFDGFERVIHLAARAGGIQFQSDGGEDVFSINRRITDNVLNASERGRAKRVFLASSAVIYRPSSRPIVETDPLLSPGDHPSPYAWSKITDEVVASWRQNLETVIGRFGNVYGPGAPFDASRSTVIHALIDRAARLDDGDELVVWGDGSAVRSFIYVADVARAVLDVLMGGAAGEAYNIDGGEPVTIRELATTVRDVVNPTLRLTFDDSKPSGTAYRVGSIAKIERIGFVPMTSLQDGIRETFAWYRRQWASG